MTTTLWRVLQLVAATALVITGLVFSRQLNTVDLIGEASRSAICQFRKLRGKASSPQLLVYLCHGWHLFDDQANNPIQNRIDSVFDLPSSQRVNLCPDRSRFYCQTRHPIDDRIDDLMSYMTLSDKFKTASQQSISGTYWDETSLVARKYVWWSESLHGVFVRCGKICPTSFPEANALSCAWNASLWGAVANAIGNEARAYFNEGALQGLTFYAPNINMAAHPLWGRIMETPGEDPHLTSVFAKEYISGLQGCHPHIIKAMATPKHFVGHFFEGDGSDPWLNGTRISRFSNDTQFSLRDLEQYYLVPFRAALKDAKAGSLMCAYLSVNGVPMCANGFLLNRVVRQDWNWNGFVVSDCDAIATMTTGKEFNGSHFHSYSLDEVGAVQDGLRAGCDQNCGDMYSAFGMRAVSEGCLSEEQIHVSVRRQLRALFQLGLFDPLEQDPYADLGWNDVGTAFHKQLALEAAQQSIVLLQNGVHTHVLPLSNDQRILLAGPMYNATVQMLGNYHGAACKGSAADCLVSLTKALNPVSSVLGVPPGCRRKLSGIDEVVAAAHDVDVVVLALGGVCHEAEGADRKFLYLPGSQIELYRAVYKVGKPIVVVIINGGPYAIDEIRKNEDVAVIQAGFPGQAGGQAIADVLLGNINPSGKLTTTIYPSSYANGTPTAGTPWMNSNLRPTEDSEGRTYMFFTGTPLFPFGYGLSYTTFLIEWEKEPPILSWKYNDLLTEKSLDHSDRFRIRLTNTGNVTGRETVQAYWSPPADVDYQLKRQLFGFQSATLRPGESTVLTFSVRDTLNSISTVTPFGDRMVYEGRYLVTFTRGHGSDVLQSNVTATSSDVVRRFPSAWVEQHEVTLEACVEGTTDIVPHIEPFLMAYKQWEWVGSKYWLRHIASKMCLTYNPVTTSVHMQRCQSSNLYQNWNQSSGRIWPWTQPSCCLLGQATQANQLRRPVTIGCGSTSCEAQNTLWNWTSRSMLRNMLADATTQHGLCLAARSEGRFNYGY